jgi:DNA-binding NarL/FixJ family response regulator
MEKIIRIGLVEDHLLFRKTLAATINQFENCLVMLEVGNGIELQQALTNGLPDIILLDLHMPVMNGYKSLDWLQQNHPLISVIIVSMCDVDFNIVRLLRAGARAFIKKTMPPDELRNAIYSVHEKGFYYTDCTTRKLFNVLYNNFETEFDFSNYGLSDNEIGFLQYSATDLPYKEIAREMKLSERRIDKIRSTLFLN